jgi:hypothetical protein
MAPLYVINPVTPVYIELVMDMRRSYLPLWLPVLEIDCLRISIDAYTSSSVILFGTKFERK